MFKLNLYPEYQLKQQQKRKRTLLTAAAAAVVCVQLLVIGFQVMNTTQLAAQINSVDSELSSLQAYVDSKSQPVEEMTIAGELLDLRRARMLWAPKLAALTQITDKSTYLVKLKGHRSERDHDVSLEITGVSTKTGEQLEHVSLFLKDLRANDSFGRGFDEIALGNMLGGESGKFMLNCSSVEE